jgi:cell division septation protein DedD
MRSLFIVLLLANLILFGMGQGWFGEPVSQRGRDPERLQQEIRPEEIEVPRIPGVNAAGEQQAPVQAALTSAIVPAMASPEATAVSVVPVSETMPHATLPAPVIPAPEPVTEARLACVEWGNFNDTELGVAKRWSQEHLPHVAVDTRRADGKSNWMVLIPPQPTAAAAQATASQLSKRGIKDFFVIQEPGQYQHAISLGVFRTEEAAHKLADALQGQGVRGAKVVTRNSTTTKSWLVLHDLPARDRQTLQDARSLFAKQTVRDC